MGYNMKSIAIVGGANSIFDKKHGEEIDSHDIVIRCNWSGLYHNKLYTGEKIDIWALGINNNQILKDIKDFPFFKEIWIVTFSRQIIKNNRLKIPLLEKLCDKLIRIDDKFWKGINNKISDKIPTSGFITVLMTLDKFPKHNIDIYGFSKNENDNMNFYTGLNITLAHNFNKEREILQSIGNLNYIV